MENVSEKNKFQFSPKKAYRAFKQGVLKGSASKQKLKTDMTQSQETLHEESIIETNKVAMETKERPAKSNKEIAKPSIAFGSRVVTKTGEFDKEPRKKFPANKMDVKSAAAERVKSKTNSIGAVTKTRKSELQPIITKRPTDGVNFDKNKECDTLSELIQHIDKRFNALEAKFDETRDFFYERTCDIHLLYQRIILQEQAIRQLTEELALTNSNRSGANKIKSENKADNKKKKAHKEEIVFELKVGPEQKYICDLMSEIKSAMIDKENMDS